MDNYITSPNPDLTAWQVGQQTELDLYSWLERSKQCGITHQLTAKQFPGTGAWLDVVDFGRAQTRNSESVSDVAFVDIGGGQGQLCRELVRRYSEIQGRLICQDRQEVICRSPGIKGVEMMAYDFSNVQPVKGERSGTLREYT